ncbi:MAG: exopolysaccharide biosynthesis protein [Solirubrobacteraceae bacterium]
MTGEHEDDRAGTDTAAIEPDKKLSAELKEWLAGEGERTLGALVDAFGKKSFAILFVLLLGVPALPLPTGGATHVFEVIAALLALELIVGRRQVWLPRRWHGLKLGGDRQRRFIAALTGLIRRLERLSRPRLAFLFDHRLSNIVFGLLVLGGTAGAFFAPPFTGLDTLPSLGVVVLALGVLLEDFLVVAVGLVVGVAGIALEIVVGAAALHGLNAIF